MGALADVFAAVRLQLDGTGFEAQATALADKSGKNAGDRMSANLSASLKNAAGAAIGAAAGAAFGMALTGANELDAATRQLQADTGMTAEEAKNAEHALAGMYKTNLQGFDEIGAVMAVVHNALGLTGDAADAATERFLKYATATGQSAAPAASDFAEILKAFNIDASHTPAIMDKLIASHQVYGTVVTESQAALVKMGPAMVAANMTIDDGIALLNAFQVAGVDAAKAPTALAAAVKKLKPGQDLNDLIAQIAAIQDPTLRAQKAMEIFGGKAVGWAKVFADNTVVLSDFNTTTAENANAMTDAAAVIEEGFGNRLKLVMKDAEGTLAEFGTGFGDLIGIAQLFGPQMTTAVMAGLGGLGGLLIKQFGAAVVGATIPAAAAGTTVGAATGTAAGTALPSAFAAAAALAFPAVIGAFIIAAGTMIALALDDLFPGLAKKMHDQFFAGVDAVTTALKGSSSGLIDNSAAYDRLGLSMDATLADFGRIPPAAAAAAVDVTRFGDASLAAAGKAAAMARQATASGDASLTAAYGYDTAAAATAAQAAAMAAAYPKINSTTRLLTGLGDVADDVTTATARMGDKIKSTWSELGSIASGAADAIFGPATRATAAATNARAIDAQKQIIAHHNLTTAEQRAVEAQIIAQQRKMAELRKNHASAATLVNAQIVLDKLREKASGNVTAAEKLDAATRLLALQKEGLGIRIEMAGRGELTKADYDILIGELQAQSKTGSIEVRNAATVALQELARLKAGIIGVNVALAASGAFQGTGRTYARAGGGPVSAGMPYIVGERRPELFVPSTNGTIIPQVPGASSSFSPTVNVSVNAGSDVSLGAARRFGQAVADEVANVLQEQNARFTSRLRVARA